MFLFDIICFITTYFIMKQKINTLEESIELYEKIIEIVMMHGYKKSGNGFLNWNDDCVILLEEYSINLSSVIPLTIVKEIGMALRKHKNKDVSLVFGGSLITHKQIKTIIEMEKQAA